jgi:hypothetical protein
MCPLEAFGWQQSAKAMKCSDKTMADEMAARDC